MRQMGNSLSIQCQSNKLDRKLAAEKLKPMIRQLGTTNWAYLVLVGQMYRINASTILPYRHWVSLCVCDVDCFNGNKYLPTKNFGVVIYFPQTNGF